MHKTGIINPNKLSNYIFTSKTNYSNYKRVPHLKSEAKDKNSILLTNQTNQINQNNNINDQLWFKTQYKNFKELKDVSNFTISEYNKKSIIISLVKMMVMVGPIILIIIIIVIVISVLIAINIKIIIIVM